MENVQVYVRFRPLQNFELTSEESAEPLFTEHGTNVINNRTKEVMSFGLFLTQTA